MRGCKAIHSLTVGDMEGLKHLKLIKAQGRVKDRALLYMQVERLHGMNKRMSSSTPAPRQRCLKP